MNGQDFNHIVTLLDEEDIKTIVIIDDVFDPIEKVRFFQGEIEEFCTALESNDEALQELAQLGLKISTSDDIDDGVLQDLWNCHDQTNALSEVCRTTLFARIAEDFDQLKRFRNHLENDLGREVIVLGRGDNLDECAEKTIKLIFIDYYLESAQESVASAHALVEEALESEPSFSARASIEKIKEMYSKHQPRPLVVLMSSKDPSSEMIAQFRDDSGLLQGMFHFIPKEDFFHRDRLFLKLGTFAKSLPTGYKIQHFVEALEKSIGTVSTKFLADIRKLSLNDYAYIQKLSLQADGHPLGDYMLWLYSSYFGHLLFESEIAVRTQREEVDNLTFEHLPPIHISPSLQLAEIYRSALFDINIGDLRECSLKRNAKVISSSEDTLTSNKAGQSTLHLGDLFIKDNHSDVLMVINAECDLVFTLSGKDRPFDPERSIILIPGELQPLNRGSVDPEKVRTELFEYQGDKYRILWNVKTVVFYPYGEVATWLKKQGFKRIARLRLPFALEIQRAFATSLTRIGMPVSPPIFQPARVHLFHKGEDNNYAPLEEPIGGLAFLAFTKSGEQCMLNMDCMLLLFSKIVWLVEKIEEQTKSLNPNSDNDKKRLERLGKLKSELSTSQVDYQSWLQILTPFQLKSGEEKVFLGVPVKFCRDKTTEGQYSHKEPLLVNIINSQV